MKVLYFALALSLLAGCAATPSSPAAHTSSTSTPSASAEKPLGNSSTTPPSQVPDGLDLTGCHGIGFTMDTDRALFDPSFPPGWEPDADQAVMAIDHFVHDCSRISWGPFERPIRLALESVDVYSGHGKCLDGDYTFGWILQSVWIEDPEVYQFARDVYGMPARLVTFTESNTSVQDGHLIEWTMSTEGTTGRVSFYDLPGQTFQGPSPQARYFWFNGKGISYVDWQDEYLDDQLTVRAVNGVLPPPFLYGRSALPDDFVARANLFEQGSVHAPIHRFGDVECKQPL